MTKEPRPCANCQQSYTASVQVRQDGTEKVFPHFCPQCQKKKEQEEQQRQMLSDMEQALKQLPDAIDDQRDAWWGDSNIPRVFQTKTFQSFDKKLQPHAFKATKELQWQGEFDDKKDGWVTPPRSLVLLSPNLYGVGKTHLVCALANQILMSEQPAAVSSRGAIIRRRCPLYFTTENHLLNRIRATYNQPRDRGVDEDGADKPKTEEDIYVQLLGYRLLIIDDVGKVRPRDYSFLQGVYFRIIDDRYCEERPMILTTNLSLTELEEHIGGACADRLREMCGENFIVMKGQSYRAKLGSKQTGTRSTSPVA